MGIYCTTCGARPIGEGLSYSCWPCQLKGMEPVYHKAAASFASVPSEALLSRLKAVSEDLLYSYTQARKQIVEDRA